MDRTTILAGIHEILSEIVLKYDPSPVTLDTLIVNVSSEIDSLTLNELILGLEERFEMDEIEQGVITSETKISDIVDMVANAKS
jgi:acyl carrier protein